MATAYVVYLQGSKTSERLERTSTDLGLEMSVSEELLLCQKLNLEQYFQDGWRWYTVTTTSGRSTPVTASSNSELSLLSALSNLC